MDTLVILTQHLDATPPDLAPLIGALPAHIGTFRCAAEIASVEEWREHRPKRGSGMRTLIRVAFPAGSPVEPDVMMADVKRMLKQAAANARIEAEFDLYWLDAARPERVAPKK